MNILLTSVGRRSYLAQYFKSALDGTGLVIGANAISDTSGLMACDVREITPFAFDREYVPTLLDICQRHGVKLLFALHELDAPFIADARDQLEAIGTTPVLPDRQFLDIALDKYKTGQFMQEHGLSVPLTWRSRNDALADIKAGKARFPLVVKPRCGYGSIGLQVVHDADELNGAWALSLGLIKRSWIAQASVYDAESPLIIQQAVQGEEYGIDVINDLQRRYVTTFVEHKLAMRSGETEAAEIVDSQPLMAFGESIGRMGLHPGALDLDVIVDDGVILVIDMNPRFGAHYPFAHLAGADVPSALIAWARGKRPDAAWLRAEVGVRGYKELVPTRFP